MGYPLDRLRQEVAYIAFHFHWPYESIMEMEHQERQEWVDEISGIVKTWNQAAHNPQLAL